jgi:serine/threonine protein kinase
MDLRSWPLVRGIFERALDLPVGERASFVDRETDGQDALRREVMRLLESTTGSGDFLSPPEPGASLGSAFDWRPTHGESIGSYRIESLLGEGGMGAVYLARQDRPSRDVALKLMHARFASPRSRRRFEFEAEVLGRLRHPGIAAIHEMGVHRTPDGGEVPFFAMEYVEGARDLATYADDEGLDLAARIALFRAVCAAVHHAHEKGVIHRDLKPGNILVDATGQPKVIDYGVARAIDHERAEACAPRRDSCSGPCST